jgi:hypothetical protein
VSTKEASRRSPEHDAWALRIKQRAGWKCEGCKLTADWIRRHGGRYDAAHELPYSEYPEHRFDDDNGRALCYFPKRNHPQGLGRGYGCHNAMSNHWGNGDSAGPSHRDGDRWELVGLGLLAVSVLLFVIAFKAHSHRPAWFGDAVTVLAVSVPLWWVKRRLLIASILIGNVLWTLLIAANVAARHSFLRPWTFGSPSSFGGFLAAAVVLLALWGACVILVHAVLRRRWLSRAGRVLLHALVRLARWAQP